MLWRRGDAVRDLGTLPGEVTSQASGLNNRGQVVGASCDADGVCRAFLWRGGVMTDLNSHLAPDTVLHLESAQAVNDAGMITGRALDPAGGRPAYVAMPR